MGHVVGFRSRLVLFTSCLQNKNLAYSPHSQRSTKNTPTLTSLLHHYYITARGISKIIFKISRKVSLNSTITPCKWVLLTSHLNLNFVKFKEINFITKKLEKKLFEIYFTEKVLTNVTLKLFF